MIYKTKKTEIPILMYHEIVDDSSRDEGLLRKMQGSYFVKSRIFQQQMDFLHREGFKTISLTDLINYFKDPLNNALPEKSLIITFDDGYGGNYKHAFPVLKKYGFCSTFFITVKSVGSEFMMNWSELKYMAEFGMSIQSHTLTHQFLKQLNDQEVKTELGESKDILEDKLKIKVDFVALPNGSYGNNYKRIAKEIGYLGGCSSDPGMNHVGIDVYLLRRIHISSYYSLSEFSKIVNNDTAYINYLTIKKNSKMVLKGLLGEKVYLKLYNVIFGVKG